LTLAARASLLTPVVHAVDDGGALCGSEPRPRWRRSTVLPVNCPACLVRMSTDRYARCGVPGAATDNLEHVRLLGPEGLRTVGGTIHGRTLCGLPAGWDIAPFTPADLSGDTRRLCRGCRARYRANAVR
jgi:hypothetical protein